MRYLKAKSPSHRSGSVLVYTVISMVALMGFCSLAIDLGRYETTKTQLRRAAVAAARAAVANITTPGSATSTQESAASAAAISMAGQNTCDGNNISTLYANHSLSITVNYVKWTSISNNKVLNGNNISKANAIQVIITYNVPLIFGQAVGIGGKNVTESSTACITVDTVSPYVSAKSNPWLAGQTTTGTQASQPDPAWDGQNVNTDHPWQYDLAGPVGGSARSGEPYESPVQVSFTVNPGSVITVTNVSGTAGNDVGQGAVATADGSESGTFVNYDDYAANGTSEHGIADATMPLNSLNGVFLGTGLPDNTTAPPPLDFSDPTSRDYGSILPKLKQVFYMGDGLSSTDQQLTVTVPPNATRFYLGTMDGWEWSNNVGGYNVTITQTSITVVQ